jgi:hypothetical protein
MILVGGDNVRRCYALDGVVWAAHFSSISSSHTQTFSMHREVMMFRCALSVRLVVKRGCRAREMKIDKWLVRCGGAQK